MNINNTSPMYFNVFRQHHLYLKLEKCEFNQSTVQFLGYVITPDGVQMDQGEGGGQYGTGLNPPR